MTTPSPDLMLMALRAATSWDRLLELSLGLALSEPPRLRHFSLTRPVGPIHFTYRRRRAAGCRGASGDKLLKRFAKQRGPRGY